MYKHKDPEVIDINDIRVPIHFPNNIPDKISIGDPNPKRITQTIEKTKNKKRFNNKFFPTISLIFN